MENVSPYLFILICFNFSTPCFELLYEILLFSTFFLNVHMYLYVCMKVYVCVFFAWPAKVLDSLDVVFAVILK